MIRVLLISTLVGAAVAQLQLNRLCAPQNTMAVNFTEFAGTWYQIERIPNSEEHGECSTSTYFAPTLINGNSGPMRSREIMNRAERVQNGHYFTNGPVVGTWQAGYERDFPGIYYVSWHYMLHTDYRTHAFIYSCRNNTATGTSTVFAWQLSKSTSLSRNSMSSIQRVIRNHEDLRNANWKVVDHTRRTCGAGTNLYNPPLLALITLFMISYKIN